MNRYHRWLLALLCAGALFSGFAGFALSQTLPHLRQEFALSREQAGHSIALINIGQVLSYLLVHSADRVGRRPIYLVSLLGFALASMASAFMPEATWFGLAQLVTRLFLLATPAVAAIIAAEEFPAEKRGLYIGIIFACGGLGGVLCAALVPQLNRLFLGWRTVYLVSGLPLLFLGPAWRFLKETEQWRQLPREARAQSDLWSVWRTGARGRVVQLAAVWFLTNLCGAGVILFWKEFALTERSLPETRIGAIIATASLFAIPGSFLFGKVSDRLGRRRAAVIVYSVAIAGVAGAFSLRSQLALTLSLFCAIGSSYALPGLLSTVTTESFSTRIRAAAFAWTNNLLGRAAFIVAPLLIGWLAQRIGWGPAVLLTIVGPCIALVLVLRLRETAGSNLAQEESRP